MKRIVVAGPHRLHRSIAVRFDDRPLTNFGGALALKSFLDAGGYLDHVRREPDSGRYSLREIVESLLFLRIAGIDRLSHAGAVAEDPLFEALLGQRPSVSTLFRRLARDGRELQQAFATLRDRVADPIVRSTRGRHVIALDGTALTVFGQQELATRGYNLERRGAKCYQPLIATSVTNRMVLHGVMRPGNASAAAEADGMVNDLALRLGRNVELLADAGFYGDRLLSQVEDLGWKYVMAAVGRATLVREAQKTTFQALSSDVEIGEFVLQTRSMFGEVSIPRRYIVVRRFRKRPDPKQATLLDARPCELFFYVTNLACKPEEVWRRYNRRSEIELVLRDLKESFALTCLPSASYDANGAHLQLCLAAYNVLRAYAAEVLKGDLARAWGERLRSILIRLAARVIRGGRRLTLALSVATPLRNIVAAAFQRSSRWRPA